MWSSSRDGSYLVQACKWKNEFPEQIVNTDNITDFKYMGSVEFEWDPCAEMENPLAYCLVRMARKKRFL